MIKVFNSYYELKKHFEKNSMPKPLQHEVEKRINDMKDLKKIKYKYSNSVSNLKFYLYIRRMGNNFLLITNIRSGI